MKPSREATLQALYEADARRSTFDSDAWDRKVGELAASIMAEQADLDRAIAAVAANWSVGRMTPVDRAILRLGLYELRHHPTTPTAVILNEAVELAKKYSTEDSGGFVNGILAELAQRERPD